MKLFLAFIACTILFVSCDDPVVPEKLNSVLTLAGDNKGQLLKTIKHFQKSGDSLKLEAAYFLIENLEQKYSYRGNTFDHLQNVVSSFRLDTVHDLELLKKTRDNIDNELSIYSTFEYSKIADAQYISSEYLIDYIDQSFKTLEFPWVKGKLDFDQFCRYVLPYKVGDEPIENWRGAVLSDYRFLIDSLSQNKIVDILQAAKIINREISKHFEARGASKISLSFGYNNLKNIGVGSCYNAVTYTISVMRAFGIPIGMDMTPLWGNRSGGHQWTVLYGADGKTVPFDPTYDFKYFFDRFHPKTNRTILPPKYAVAAKIYSVPFDGRENKRYHQDNIPIIFKQNFPDVTDRYTSTKDLTMTLSVRSPESTNAYLFAFDINSWKPIQISDIANNNTVTFKNMGRGVLYLPGYLVSNSLVPCESPFILNEKGEIRKLQPQENKLTKIIIYRKYPYLERVKSFAERMNGGVFEASNTPDFKNSVVLNKIKNTPTPYYHEAAISISGSYRYVRYVPPDSCYGDVAEIEVYSDGSKEPVYGNVIGIKGESGACGLEKAFDHDKLSYYTSLRPSGSWVGMDFGKNIRITKIRYLPRNDQNTIEPGEEYELFYWNNRWISLGIQRAEKQYLKYSVPDHAVLWLRNLNKGKEERIFTIENGRQVWW